MTRDEIDAFLIGNLLLGDGWTRPEADLLLLYGLPRPFIAQLLGMIEERFGVKADVPRDEDGAIDPGQVPVVLGDIYAAFGVGA